MTIPRISADVEKPFRDAVGHALRNEFEEMREGVLRLTDEQIASCLNLLFSVIHGVHGGAGQCVRRRAELAPSGGCRAGL